MEHQTYLVRFDKLMEWDTAMKEDSAVTASIISGENHLKFIKSMSTQLDEFPLVVLLD